MDTSGSGSEASSSSSILVGISKDANGETGFSEGNSSSMPNILEKADETSVSEISSPPKYSGRVSSFSEITSITSSKELSKLSRDVSCIPSSSEGKRLVNKENGSSFSKSGGVDTASSGGISNDSSCTFCTSCVSEISFPSTTEESSSGTISSGGTKLYSSFQKESKGSIS